MKQVGKLNPFGRFCCTIGNLPTSYMESLTYEQQLLWFCKFLDTEVIPAVNSNAEAIIELQNYLKNLDLQDEVNNKLDEMAESGQLTEIIAQYLQLAGLLCYNTKADLKGAENLVDGSYAKTFGTNTYNDGYGHDYKIRTLLNTDVIDDDNLIALTNYPTLVAEKIPNNNFNSTFTNLQNQITVIDNNVLTEMVVIGDSYTAFSNSTWAETLATHLHLNLHKHAASSMGYAHPVDNKVFSDLLDWDDTSFYNKVKYVICYGGINDYDQTRADIETGVDNFITKAKTNFPNAQIILAGPQAASDQFNDPRSVKERLSIERSAEKNGVAYVDPHDWLVNNTFNYTSTYANDNLHPSAPLGYNIIASKFLGVINNECQSGMEIVLDIYPGNTGSVEFTKEKTHIHFAAKVNVTATSGAYTQLLTIKGPENIDISTNFDGFLSRQSYFPVFKLNGNNVSEIVGAARIGTSGSNYSINFVNISSTFTGTVALSGDLYFDFIKNTVS